MTIINEELLGRSIDRFGITDSRNALKFGIVLVKYYRSKGYSNSQIKQVLRYKIKIKGDYNNTCADYIYNMIVANMNMCGEYKVDPIPITKKEVELLDSMKNRRAANVMFIMIVYCKCYGNCVRISKSEVLKNALVPHSIRTFDTIFQYLNQEGLLKLKAVNYRIGKEKKTDMAYSLTDKVLKLSENDEIAFTVHDTNSPIYFYLAHTGEAGIVKCEHCNEMIGFNCLSHPPRHPLCKICALDVRNAKRKASSNEANKDFDS